MTEMLKHGPVRAPVEGVVLLHGLGRSRAAMQVLAMRLEAAGFRTATIGYPSRHMTLAQAVEHVSQSLARVTEGWDVVHLAGHSLGGVIAISILGRLPQIVNGRVVMLGSPMRGSALAEFIGRSSLTRRFFGPVLDDLSRPGPLRPRDYRVGAIAGTGGSKALGRRLGLAGPHDGKVTLRSAWNGAKHRVALPSGHAMMPFSAEVARLTAYFLRHGRFPDEAIRAA